MLEDDHFNCQSCGKTIRHERPLFCPYCGSKVDPSVGLEGDSAEVTLYPWARVAPALMYSFLLWIAATLALTLIFGRVAFIAMAVLLTLFLVFVSGVSLLLTRKKSGLSKRPES